MSFECQDRDSDREEQVGRYERKAKRLLGLVLSAVICMTTAVCVMPTDVRAFVVAEVEVGDEDVTTGIYNTEHDLGTGGMGKVTYTSGNLTLNGVTVPGAMITPVSGVYSKIDLTVNIVGTNRLGAYSNGLSTDDTHSLTLSGEGTLNAGGMDYNGIKAGSNLTINGGTITATGKQNGLYAVNGNITITGGTITATSTNGFGLYTIDDNNITITGGSLIAEGKAGHGAFNRQPSFGGNWYKWRTSKDGAFTDSQVTVYTWNFLNPDTYVEIVPRDGTSTPTTTSSTSGALCAHEYEWV